MVPPAPRPHTARAAIKLPIESDNAHQRFVSAKMVNTSRNTSFLPTVSDRRPQRGWNPVLVIMKTVVNHEAELEALK